MNVDSILQEIGAMKTKMNKKEKIVKTPEEAIETIKSNMPTSGYQMLRESLIMAIGALEKQIPKAPDYEAIIDEWNAITKKIGADIVVLDMPLLDTRKGKDLMGTFIADLVLQILSFVAETERRNIKQRQAEGIAAAKARGVRFGRPARDLPENFLEMCQKWKAGSITGIEAAEACGMPMSTFRYRAEQMRR